jgi:hypothetical protein
MLMQGARGNIQLESGEGPVKIGGPPPEAREGEGWRPECPTNYRFSPFESMEMFLPGRQAKYFYKGAGRRTLNAKCGNCDYCLSPPLLRDDSAVINAGLDFAVSRTTTLGISYGGQFGSNATDQSARGNLVVKF